MNTLICSIYVEHDRVYELLNPELIELLNLLEPADLMN